MFGGATINNQCEDAALRGRLTPVESHSQNHFGFINVLRVVLASDGAGWYNNRLVPSTVHAEDG